MAVHPPLVEHAIIILVTDWALPLPISKIITFSSYFLTTSYFSSAPLQVGCYINSHSESTALAFLHPSAITNAIHLSFSLTVINCNCVKAVRITVKVHFLSLFVRIMCTAPRCIQNMPFSNIICNQQQMFFLLFSSSSCLQSKPRKFQETSDTKCQRAVFRLLQGREFFCDFKTVQLIASNMDIQVLP